MLSVSAREWDTNLRSASSCSTARPIARALSTFAS